GKAADSPSELGRLPGIGRGSSVLQLLRLLLLLDDWGGGWRRARRLCSCLAFEASGIALELIGVQPQARCIALQPPPRRNLAQAPRHFPFRLGFVPLGGHATLSLGAATSTRGCHVRCHTNA